MRIFLKSKDFPVQDIISSRHKSTRTPLAGLPLIAPRQGGKGSAFSAWFMTPCLAGEKSNKSSYGPSPQRPADALKIKPSEDSRGLRATQPHLVWLSPLPPDLGAARILTQVPEIFGKLNFEAAEYRDSAPNLDGPVELRPNVGSVNPLPSTATSNAPTMPEHTASNARSIPQAITHQKRFRAHFWGYWGCRHGSTFLNATAAAQATFPGKERGRPSLHPAASHPRQASHTCRGMGFRAVR